MIAFGVTILLSILTIFSDSFFVALAGIRIFPVLVIALYNKVNWRYLTVFVLLVSLALDVIFHYVLGTNLLILAIILFLGRITSIFVPWENNLGGYGLKYIGFVLYHILLAAVPSVILNGSWGILSWSVVGGALLRSLLAVGFCVAFDLIWSRIRSREDSSNKLKLK